MSRKLTTLADLATAGLIAPSDEAALAAIAERYAIAISPPMAALAIADPHGPVARQFVPDAREAHSEPIERPDPIGDDLKSPVPGLVHRYQDRVLLKLATACPVYCRFCFRREKVGPGQPAHLTAQQLSVALDYISATPAIFEVIITGGDPLVLAPRHLAKVTKGLAEIPHVRLVRWHTRVPVVTPALMTDKRIAALNTSGKTTYVALHVNHRDELTDAADRAILALRQAGSVLVAQTVLLRGINDTVAALEDLMRALTERGVMPYYLHHPDLAPGTSHFRMELDEGQALVRALRQRLSGIAQPTYVLDIPGAHGKIPVGPNYVNRSDDAITLTDPAGGTHRYPPDV